MEREGRKEGSPQSHRISQGNGAELQVANNPRLLEAEEAHKGQSRDSHCVTWGSL